MTDMRVIDPAAGSTSFLLEVKRRCDDPSPPASAPARADRRHACGCPISFDVWRERTDVAGVDRCSRCGALVRLVDDLGGPRQRPGGRPGVWLPCREELA